MNDDLRLHCNGCAQKTRHGVLREYQRDNAEGEAIKYAIVQCAGCEAVSFYEEHSQEDKESAQWQISEFCVFPLRQLRAPRFFAGVPANLEQLYRETVDALNAGLFLFCASGLRALVEGICADQHITDGPKRDGATGAFVQKNGTVTRNTTLDCKIEGLLEKHLVTPGQAKTLHEQRYLGNKALHELEVPSADMLGVALGLLEHILVELYDMPTQIQGLKQVRTGTADPLSES